MKAGDDVNVARGMGLLSRSKGSGKDSENVPTRNLESFNSRTTLPFTITF